RHLRGVLVGLRPGGRCASCVLAQTPPDHDKVVLSKSVVMPVPTEDKVTEALRSVIDPELRRSIVELEMVRSIDIHSDGRVDVVVSLTTPGRQHRAPFRR